MMGNGIDREIIISDSGEEDLGKTDETLQRKTDEGLQEKPEGIAGRPRQAYSGIRFNFTSRISWAARWAK